MLKFDSDASSLSIPPPRVQVKLDSFVKEDLFIAGGILDFLATVLCLIGTAMFVIPTLVRQLKHQKNMPERSAAPG